MHITLLKLIYYIYYILSLPPRRWFVVLVGKYNVDEGGVALAASDRYFSMYVVFEVVNTVFLPRLSIPLHIFPFNLVFVWVGV